MMDDERTQDKLESEEHENENGGAGGAMNSSNDSHDILPIAISITRFKHCVDYTAVEQQCLFALDPFYSGVGGQQINTTNSDDDLDVTPSDEDENVRPTIRCRSYPLQELIIPGRVQQINANSNDDLDDLFPPSNKDEDVGPTIRCPDCARVGQGHYITLQSPIYVRRFRNCVEKFMQERAVEQYSIFGLDRNTCGGIQKINRNSDDDDRDGTPSASCKQNGVDDGAVGRWDILDLPCPDCRRAALLHSLHFEDKHCALKWIDFGVPVNANDWEHESDILTVCIR